MALDQTTVLYSIAVVWVSAALQGITGFGYMMLAVPALILIFPPQVVVPALIMTWIPLGSVQVVQFRRHVDWGILAQLLASSAVALPLGAVILRDTDPATMQRAIGVLLVGLAVVLQVKPGPPFRHERAARVGAGLVAGLLASSTSVSGPPLVLLGLKQRWETEAFRSTLPAFFLAIAFLCLPLHWGMDLLGDHSISLAVYGAPGLVLGYLTGVWLRRRVRGRAFRWAAIGLVMAGGLAAVVS
ncbi:MAG: sulfite exporter TauE/SafE family protein [Candidatus Latescibacteria bacterium]|jgi:hypothetical protein|nr:sulfite exporter TauE/SafE family protein [Candidatus Latescibacterota bacterium]